MYVKVNNETATKYSLSQLKRDNPNVSFPAKPSDALLSSYDVHPLVDGDRPSVDIVEVGPIQEINGVWTQTYTGRNFTAEEKRQRMEVTMRQARLALLQQGLLENVTAAIALIPEPDKSKISIEWEYASTVERTSPWMSTMGAALGLTDEQLDQLFETASTL
jgi:hypothetical protein